MQALTGCRVLLVEDDEDSRFLIAAGLRLHGAETVEASSGEEALAGLATSRPDVLVSDLQLAEMNGTELMRRVRSRPGFETLPGIALTGHAGQSQREAAFQAGFAKHLLKPAKLTDLVAAIVAMEIRAPSTREVPGELRAMLLRLSEISPCRFTSLLRFSDDATLASVWTHDRENPAIDAFPLGLPIEARYCVLVRAERRTCTIEDAARDPRTAAHPKRDELASYIGSPVYRPDGQMFGTLCSYDARSRAIDDRVRAAIETATKEIEVQMTWIFDDKI
jgi:CheY-like chemotaxis protein